MRPNDSTCKVPFGTRLPASMSIILRSPISVWSERAHHDRNAIAHYLVVLVRVRELADPGACRTDVQHRSCRGMSGPVGADELEACDRTLAHGRLGRCC